jgi:hypothetical protein
MTQGNRLETIPRKSPLLGGSIHQALANKRLDHALPPTGLLYKLKMLLRFECTLNTYVHAMVKLCSNFELHGLTPNILFSGGQGVPM